MPDQVGAFMLAGEIISSLGLNITRVSYNKAIDTHMLFLEAEGEEAQLQKATQQLTANGYLQNSSENGNVILIEFKLRDIPGSVLPVLQLISSFQFNISYISSQENGSDYQYFRMGLFVENGADISAFLKKASRLCDIRIIDYNRTEKILDNTVFYISFANRIAEKLGLNEDEKGNLIIQSNLVMELLDQRACSPYKTFEYIGRFADQLCMYKGNAYKPRITRYRLSGERTAVLLEPPCGSNLCILELRDRLVCIDSGFSCYQEETKHCLRTVFPDFDSRQKEMILTHADVDHCGMADLFDKIFLSRKAYAHFIRERNGADNFREENPMHAPYVRISKILSRYLPPDPVKLHIIGGSETPLSDWAERIGTIDYEDFSFEVYEGCGGHVPGEIILIDRMHHIAFTGDIYVNIKGFTPEQAAFNQLAPYLMTSVDTDPALAAQERRNMFTLFGEGKWLLFGGHGSAKEIDL